MSDANQSREEKYGKGISPSRDGFEWFVHTPAARISGGAGSIEEAQKSIAY